MKKNLRTIIATISINTFLVLPSFQATSINRPTYRFGMIVQSDRNNSSSININ